MATSSTTTSSSTTGDAALALTSAPAASEQEKEKTKEELAETEGKMKEVEAKLETAKRELEAAKAEVKEAEAKLDANTDPTKAARFQANYDAAVRERDTAQANHEAASARYRALLAAQDAHLPKKVRLTTLDELTHEGAADLVEGFLSRAFTRSMLRRSPEAQKHALGVLFDPNRPVWPISWNGLIDMRLFDRKNMIGFDPTRDDPLRPAARKLARAIEGLGNHSSALAFVAVSGSGKTSCAFDLGREHWVVYVQTANKDHEHKAGRTSEIDPLFGLFITQVTATLDGVDNSPDAKFRRWREAQRLAVVNLVARLLLLARLYRDVGETLAPFDFIEQQISDSKQDFPRTVVEDLDRFDESALEAIAKATISVLAPLLQGRRLVVVLDEVESGSRIYEGMFQRDPTETRVDKGLLSPFAAAAHSLDPITSWPIVFMGTSASKDRLESLKTDVGKTRNDTLAMITQVDFPMSSTADVSGILGLLNLSADKLEGVFDAPLMASPVSRTARPRTEDPAAALRAFLEDYVVGARFRMLAAIVEQIAKAIRDHVASGRSLVLRAAERSLVAHETSLANVLALRVGPDARNIRNHNVSLDYLEQVYVASMLTDGAAQFPQSRNPLEVDLTALGIACASRVEQPAFAKPFDTVQAVQERFVLEVLAQCFADERWGDAVTRARVAGTVKLLGDLLAKLGAKIQAKGNVVERLVLERLAEANAKTVADLPFLKSAMRKEQRDIWAGVPWKKRRIMDAGNVATPAFLASDEALDVMYAPEQAMRPDGVAMLQPSKDDKKKKAPRRALVVGVAVYSGAVTRDKVDDQFLSTDLSRAFLSQEGKSYSAVQARRNDWCAKELDRTVCVRVHVILPHGPPPVEGEELLKETSVNGGATVGNGAGREHDVAVTLDASNIHLLLGPRKGNEDLYTLLRVATGTKAEEWKER